MYKISSLVNHHAKEEFNNANTNLQQFKSTKRFFGGKGIDPNGKGTQTSCRGKRRLDAFHVDNSGRNHGACT
jgi:hypothetical protein